MGNARMTSPIGRSDWSLPDSVTYLNHGSFGPSPRVVHEVREEWSRRLNANPMDFFLRQFDDALEYAATCLGKWIGSDGKDLVFVDNATVAMNIVAESLPLGPGDEVLLNDHEYGAVFRIWRAACDRVGAKVVSPTLGRGDDDQHPRRFEQSGEISESILAAIKTKLGPAWPSDHAITDFNQKLIRRYPETPEKVEIFEKKRALLPPTKKKIETYFDMIDLDEGRIET